MPNAASHFLIFHSSTSIYSNIIHLKNQVYIKYFSIIVEDHKREHAWLSKDARYLLNARARPCNYCFLYFFYN